MKPFNEGIKAFKEGRLENPYKQDTKDYRDWEFGFNKAYFSNLERVQSRGRGYQVQGSEEESAYASA
jgi:hypothetical protein